MAIAFNFEKLEIWHEALKFAHSVFALVSRLDKRYASVAQQLERAALSISLNIAEGAGRKSKADFKRFIKIATGSVNECVTILMFICEEQQISKEELKFHYEWLTKISKMLNALYKSLS